MIPTLAEFVVGLAAGLLWAVFDVPPGWIPEGIGQDGPLLTGPVWGKRATAPGMVCVAMAVLQGPWMLLTGWYDRFC